MNIFRAIFFSCMFFSANALSCSCSDENVEYMDKHSEFVFVGKLKSKNFFLSILNNKYEFEVSNLYKGNASPSVTIWGGKFDMSCGYNFKKDVNYVVFAYRQNKRLWTDRCSSWAVTTSDNRLIKDLDKLFKRSNDGSPK